MVRLQLVMELQYQIVGSDGADFIFNVHAAQTEHQAIRRENLQLSQAIDPEVATDPMTGTRFMRLHADEGPLLVRYEAILDIDHYRTDPDLLREVDARCLPLE